MATDETRAIEKLFEDRAELYAALRAAEDHATMWVYQLVSTRTSDGLGAATQALERIGKRVDAVEERMQADSNPGGTSDYTVNVNFLDPPDDGD